MILSVAALRASLAPTPHLQRVTLSLSVLSAVREGLRYINNGEPAWTGRADTLASINEVSLVSSSSTLVSMKATLPEQMESFKGFFHNRYGLPPLRSDLRFAAPLPEDTLVPFGPKFPKFELEEIDRDAMTEIARDVPELININVPVAGSIADKRDASASQLSWICVTLVTLGRCVLCGWRTKQQAFLSWLACLDADHRIDQQETVKEAN